ncbi:MAG: hypothetical protein AAFQ96_09755, partial [Pseudomonadota bacterium]
MQDNPARQSRETTKEREDPMKAMMSVEVGGPDEDLNPRRWSESLGEGGRAPDRGADRGGPEQARL